MAIERLPMGTRRVPMGIERLPMGMRRVPMGIESLLMGMRKVPMGIRSLSMGIEHLSMGMRRLQMGMRKDRVAVRTRVKGSEMGSMAAWSDHAGVDGPSTGPGIVEACARTMRRVAKYASTPPTTHNNALRK